MPKDFFRNTKDAPANLGKIPAFNTAPAEPLTFVSKIVVPLTVRSSSFGIVVPRSEKAP